MAIAYKLFKIDGSGKLHPLYINTKQVIPIGVHLVAEAGEQTKNGKVKSKLGELAYRPGWHLTEIPFADHIGKKQPDGTLHQAKNTVWCEVEYDAMKDYTPYAKMQSTNKRDQCLKYVPENGFYWYTTNPNAKVNWLISGGITVKRILTDKEVAALCRSHGVEPQPVEKRIDMDVIYYKPLQTELKKAFGKESVVITAPDNRTADVTVRKIFKWDCKRKIHERGLTIFLEGGAIEDDNMYRFAIKRGGE